MRDDGTLWLNIGDSYTSGGRTWRATDKKNPVRAMKMRPPTPEGLKPTDLIGVPCLLALALQKEGWYLRADIIWNKPNCQPENIRDRPTRSHEYLFLLSKSEHYKYFATFPQSLVEPCIDLSTRHNDLVLDPFIGSGTTGLVALKQKRRFVGIELNPSSLQIAEDRFRGNLVR
jgi:DNA modification methylase